MAERRNCIDCAHFGFSLNEDGDYEADFRCAKKSPAYGSPELQVPGIPMCPGNLASLRRVLGAASTCEHYEEAVAADRSPLPVAVDADEDEFTKAAFLEMGGEGG